MKKVFVVTYGGGHARMLKPIIPLLQSEGVEIQILALNTAELEFGGMGIKLLGYRDFTGHDPRATIYGKELSLTLDKVINSEETVAYLGENYLELVNRYGEVEAARMYSRGGRYIFEPIDFMEHILKQVQPDVILTTNSPRSEKYAVVAARKLGIPAIAFIDMFGIRCESWFREDDFADRILVLSESVKQNLVSLGRNPESVSVVGNPSFDVLANKYHNNREDIARARRASPFTVLWASQPEPTYLPETGEEGDGKLPLKIEKVLLPLFERHPDWKLIVRNHPSEEVRSYPDFITFSPQTDVFDDLLKDVHVVLTPSSTVGFQGIVMGTRLVTIDLSVLTPTMPYARMGYSIGLTRLEDVEPTLVQLEREKDACVEPPYTIRTATENAVDEILTFLN